MKKRFFFLFISYLYLKSKRGKGTQAVHLSSLFGIKSIGCIFCMPLDLILCSQDLLSALRLTRAQGPAFKRRRLITTGQLIFMVQGNLTLKS